MGKKQRRRMAFCTIIAVIIAASTATAAVEDANRARYLDQKVVEGAVKVPVLAQVAYRDALTSIEAGDLELAQDQLKQALVYDPDYPDAYFTLTRLKMRTFDPEAPVYLMQAFIALWHNFQSQRLVALNAAAALMLVFFAMSFIISIAFAIKYFPYVAHKLREILEKRFRAAAPGFTAAIILLIPLILVPGPIAILAYVTLVCWVFMHRRERILVLVLITPLVLAGIFDLPVRLGATLSNPCSLTSLLARANDSGADDHLIEAIEKSSVPGTEIDKNLALGLLCLRDARYHDASEHLFKAISIDPQRKMAYINLGNVHYLQGDYEKALQGYRKAEDIDPRDPICQFNLAQGYIKTLLMKRASNSLQIAANTGIDGEKSRYAAAALEAAEVLPKRFSKRELWQIAMTEARALPKDTLNAFTLPLARVPLRIGAWLLIAVLAAAVILSRAINPASLTFQCSNCGRLTCENCSHDNHDMSLCGQCAKTIDGVSSERVVEALLRQKRQAVFVRRGKSKRFTTMVLPGVRDIYYERIRRGMLLAGLCSLSIVFLATRGSIAVNPLTLMSSPPMWKTVLPILGIVVAYILTGIGKPSTKFRSKRYGPARSGLNDTKNESANAADAA